MNEGEGEGEDAPDPWWITGTLYENCTCQLLCPAHVSFRQRCDNDPCWGFWGVHVDHGRFGRLVMGPQDAVIAYESPPYMHDGGWTVQIFLDDAAEAAERRALERILTGEAGGPWQVLSRFVAERLETRTAPIDYQSDGKHKVLRIDGVLESAIDAVESKRTGESVTLGNLFNVIHAQVQYLAKGSSRMGGEAFHWATKGKHALYSEFTWTGP